MSLEAPGCRQEVDDRREGSILGLCSIRVKKRSTCQRRRWASAMVGAAGPGLLSPEESVEVFPCEIKGACPVLRFHRSAGADAVRGLQALLAWWGNRPGGGSKVMAGRAALGGRPSSRPSSAGWAVAGALGAVVGRQEEGCGRGRGGAVRWLDSVSGGGRGVSFVDVFRNWRPLGGLGKGGRV